MRIVLLGDILGNLEALRAALDEAAKIGYETILHTGDLVGYGAHPNEVIDLIRERGIEGVRGELDECAAWEAQPAHAGQGEKDRARADSAYQWTLGHLGFSQRNYLKDLPFSISREIGNRQVLLFHASPTDLYVPIVEDAADAALEEMADEAQADLLLFGHTRRPMHRRVGGRHFVNAGSVGRPADGDPRAAFAVIDLDGGIKVDWRRVSYDVARAARDAEAAGLPSGIARALLAGV